MADASSQEFVPTKKDIRIRKVASARLKQNVKKGWGKDIKKGLGVAAGVGLTTAAAMYPAETKNVVEQIVDNFPRTHRKAEKTIEENYPQIVDPRIKEEYRLFYPGISHDGMIRLDSVINTQRETIRDYYFASGGYEKVQSHEALIAQFAQDYDVPEDVLLGMAIIESKGDEHIVNEVSRATGLFQIMAKMGKVHGLNITNDEFDERLIPERSLYVVCEELKKSEDRWGEGRWDYGIWEWHAGAPQIYAAIRQYVIKHDGPDLGDMNDEMDFETSIARAAAYRKAVKDLSVFELLGYPEIKSMFSGENFDLTVEYVERALAAALEYKAGKQTSR